MRINIATVNTALCFCLSIFGCLSSSQYASANEIIAKGREVVRQHCTRCHVVPNMNPYGGIGSTPSFAALKWLSDWEHRFEVFYTLPPHPALVKISGLSEERLHPCQHLLLKLNCKSTMLRPSSRLSVPWQHPINNPYVAKVRC